MQASLQVVVNGQARHLSERVNVRELLEQLQLGGRRVAVELNGAILPRSRHDAVSLQDGDELVIVQAIGGG